MNINIYMKGQPVPAQDVLNWEKRRTHRVLKKLGVPFDSNWSLERLRKKLLKRKMQIGNEGLRALLRAELATAEILTKIIVRLSFNQRRFSVIEILVDQGRAEDFLRWFIECGNKNDEVSMIAASPDHYVIHTDGNNRQEVIETTGGSPLATHFFIDYEDLSSLKSSIDPNYAYQIAGVARDSTGFTIGGVRHQFKNEANGFRAKLTVEFPYAVMPWLIRCHRFHLASEFSNWIEAATRANYLATENSASHRKPC
jgi:hypothetical protein